MVDALGAFERLSSKAGELSALVVTHERLEEGGEFERKGWTAWLTWRKKDKVLGQKVLTSEGDFSKYESLQVVDRALVLAEESANPNCSGGGTSYVVVSRKHRIRLGPGLAFPVGRAPVMPLLSDEQVCAARGHGLWFFAQSTAGFFTAGAAHQSDERAGPRAAPSRSAPTGLTVRWAPGLR